MNVTLIYPLLSLQRSKVDENKQYWPPLGIAYIAAVLLKGGHQVQLLDRDLIFRGEELNLERTNAKTMKQVKAFKPQIIGFSATTPNISDVKLISSLVKKYNPNITTVLGGPHVTGEPELTLRVCPDIDIAARGEGEEIMLELASGSPLESILGLHYKCSDKILASADRPPIKDIDQIPKPALSLLDMGHYTRPSRFTSRNLSLRTTHIFTARGCPYSCHYCAGPLMGKNRLRFHSPERVLEEVKELISKYNIEALYFAEDMFLSNKERAYKILEYFIDQAINKRIVWMAQLSTKMVNSQLLSLMKQAGCVHVEYGFESGSQRVLDLMNKKVTVAQNIYAADLSRKAKIRFQGNFIVGYPGETESDFNQTIQFIKKVRPHQVSVNMFMPLPGTFIYNQLKQQHKLLPGWDDIGNQDAPQVNYADMPAGRFEELYLNARLKLIIPMNLWNFLAANIRSPLRIIYVISTQSLGLLIKTVNVVRKLFTIKLKKGMGSIRTSPDRNK